MSKFVFLLHFDYKLLSGFFFFFKILFIHFQRGEKKEKEREKNINVWLPLTWSLLETWPATQACALTGNQTSDPLVRSPRAVH